MGHQHQIYSIEILHLFRAGRVITQTWINQNHLPLLIGDFKGSDAEETDTCGQKGLRESLCLVVVIKSFFDCRFCYMGILGGLLQQLLREKPSSVPGDHIDALKGANIIQRVAIYDDQIGHLASFDRAYQVVHLNRLCASDRCCLESRFFA
jgi:hypothetical protein